MGYWARQRYQQTKHEASSMSKKDLTERIEKVAARGVTMMSDWERNFLSSLLESTAKWGRLTVKQHDILQRIEKKTDPKNIAARKTWVESFTPDMRDKLRFAAEYYLANPPYFGDAARRILAEDEYIPTEKLYRKMVLNKYVQRALDNASQVPKFTVGTMVMVRDSQSVPYPSSKLRGKLVMIVECEDDVRSATKGSRKIKVLPVGGLETIETEERYLKKAKV